MIRTLFLVALLTLAAGVALGFFVSEAGERRRARPAPPTAESVLERKVAAYVQIKGLSGPDADRLRQVLREYDQKVADLLRRLRNEHKIEFTNLSKETNERIRPILEGYPGK